MRFYTTLLLKDLLSDAPVDKICQFYSLTLGEIQAFQMSCNVFASVVSSFCRELQWWNLYNLLSQYSDRVNFVVQDELQELID